MSCRLILTYFFIIFPFSTLVGQSGQYIHISSAQKKLEVLPGKVVNLPFFVENTSAANKFAKVKITLPDRWKLISSLQKLELKPSEKKFLIYSIQIPSNIPAGKFKLKLSVVDNSNEQLLDSLMIEVQVGEVEKIELHQVSSPDYIVAGQESVSEYLLQNLGNVKKRVYLETLNCHIEGSQEITIDPGESYRFNVLHKPSAELTETIKEYFTVRALVSEDLTKSVFRPILIFPVKEKKTDFYRRFPVTASTTYLASNQRGMYEHAYQLEFSGSGYIDENGHHKIDFLARGPNNTDLSYLGLYNQYFISYQHDNLGITAGEKAYTFTPLTESSRFGLGGEGRVKLNSGLNFGFLYVKPRFYDNIKYELAAFTGFEFNQQNHIELFFILKKPEHLQDEAQLVSFNSKFQPLERTSIELELSGGQSMNNWDNAIRGNINSQFSVFNLSGNYYFAGKKYPGYYSNSKFYSGNASMRLSQKLNVGVYAREDFRNAQLDTFFVTAPYSNSFQSFISYNIASRTNLRLFWRKYERKDRLAYDKFHYQTNSINTQFSRQIKKLEYILLTEFGNTTNFLLETGRNRQTTYRGTLNMAYRFNNQHAIRLMGSYSNSNNFISREQNNFNAGLSVVNQITKKLRTNLHIQNAYSIEDYYRNRNLLQFSFEFTPNKMHKFSARSFYTLFRRQTDTPQLTLSVNYAFNFGIPLKKIITAGDFTGHITRENGEPAEGILLTFGNKTTITDNKGRFSFKTVLAGRHYLFIEQSKLAIDEIPQIPNPIEVEIMEDQVKTLNFQILKGARVSGMFIAEETSERIPGKKQVRIAHIIVELKGAFEQYRIESNENGLFSFPLVRPGEWSLKIYPSSIPEGYELEEHVFPLHLQPDQSQQLQLNLKPKKRNIIFKPNQNLLGTLNNKNNDTDKNGTIKVSQPLREVYYSIQTGAFSNKISNDSDYFKTINYDFEVKSHNLYKYFIGKFPSLKEAEKKLEKLEKIFTRPFIVKFDGGKIIQNEIK